MIKGDIMKTTNLAAALGVASMLCAGAVTADPTHPRGGANQSNAAAPTATGTNNGATCKVSFATDTTTFTPPDDMTNAAADPNSYAALGVSAVKPCMGNVIAFFNAGNQHNDQRRFYPCDRPSDLCRDRQPV